MKPAPAPTVEPWKPAPDLFVATATRVFQLIGEGYRLCIEPEHEDGSGSCFMDEGFRNIGQDRPRIPVARNAAMEAVNSSTMRKMTDEEVQEYLQVSGKRRAFYLMVM